LRRARSSATCRSDSRRATCTTVRHAARATEG
jgi:hypothetical protein